MSTGVRTAFTTTRDLAVRLGGGRADYDGLMELSADKRFVLLGEATHGTREFYALRADITRLLVEEGGFDAIAIEADWPDCARVSRYVQGESGDDGAGAFVDFDRFPRWMWRNHQMVKFVQWLRECNRQRPTGKAVGVYGLDLYSLYRSIEAVISYLDMVDPAQAELARHRYACLDHHCDPQRYGYEAAFGLRPHCREAAIAQLHMLRERAGETFGRMVLPEADAQFYAERNAEAVVNAERYYRALFGAGLSTWNLRDAHMRDTLFALSEYGREHGRSGRVVVWAHNTHVGDARATEVSRHGEWNLGQLVRERTGNDALLVGFTTYAGDVAAASRWDGDVELKRVRPALPGSYEHLFHSTRLDRFFLPLVDDDAGPLRDALLERAIGVIYHPQRERTSHYFLAELAAQFDAIFHLDETAAVEPLDLPASWNRPSVPETEERA